MCRSQSQGGRRCSGEAAGQGGDTPPPGGTSGSGNSPPPRPSAVNIVTGNATVGGQYEDAHIHGGVTITPGGVTLGGPVTGTPSAPPSAGQAEAAEAVVARAMETARNALRAAADASRSAHATGGTGNVAGDDDVIGIQVGGRTYRRRSR